MGAPNISDYRNELTVNVCLRFHRMVLIHELFLGATMKAFSTLKALSVFIATSAFSASVCSAAGDAASSTTVYPPNARYVIVLHPTYRADEFLIDTKTGKVWQATLTNQGGELFWQQMRFTNFDSKKEQRYWDTLPR